MKKKERIIMPHAIIMMLLAILCAAGFGAVFQQDSVPTATRLYDLWVDTDDSDNVYLAFSSNADEVAAGEWVDTPVKVVAGSAGAGIDYTTIDSAIEGATDGDIILIKDTTGGICTAGVWDEYIRIAASNNETLYIMPHYDNTNDITVKPSDAKYPLRLDTDTATGTYVFVNIDFDGTDATVAYLILSASTKSLTFVDCDFTAGSNQQKADFNKCSIVKLNNCDIDFMSAATTSLPAFQFQNNSQIFVENCSFVTKNDCLYTQNDSDFSTLPDYVYLANNNFSHTSASAASAGDAVRIGFTNNFVHAQTATGGGNDYILLNCSATLVDDHWNGAFVEITGGTGSGQIAAVIDYDATGNGNGEKYAQVDAVWATNPDNTSTYLIYHTPVTTAIVTGNSYTNASAAIGYGIQIGQGVKHATVRSNYSYDPVSESAMMIRCVNAKVENNLCLGKYACRWQGTGSGYFGRNTFITTDSGTALTPAHAFLWYKNYLSDSESPCGSIICENNIFYAAGQYSYCIGDEKDGLGGDHEQARFDYNCYYATDSANVGNLDGSDYATLALVQGKWAAPASWGSETLVWTTNDLNSISVNPLFDSNYKATNPRLKNAGSTLLIKSDGTELLWNDIGAENFTRPDGLLGGGGLID